MLMSKRTLRALALAFSILTSLHAAPKLPRPAEPLTIIFPDGKEFPLAGTKGKVVALAFVLTTCPHCQNYTRVLNKMHYEFSPQGLQVVMSAIEENAKAALPAFIRAFAPPYSVGYNDLSLVSDFLQNPRTQVLHMPVIVFIDRKGMILGQYQAGEPFMEQNPEQNLKNTILGLLRGTITPETVAKEEAEKKAKAPSVTIMPADAPPAKGAPAKGAVRKTATPAAPKK
jgi:cytochrome oxidase Cu insertion factor (SCO1/SenC/PrrC family)